MFISKFPPSPAPRLQLFVNDLGTTGVVRNAIAIANAAAAAGYQVRLLTCRPDGPLREQVSPHVTLVGLLRVGTRSGNRAQDLRSAFFAYRRHCREWRPDIMLSAGNHGHLASTFAWAGLPGVKVLRISNDLDQAALSWPKRLRRRIKLRFVSAIADLLVLNSQALGGHPVLAPHVARGKAITVPNGVDVSAVTRAARAPCSHPWVVDGSIPIVLSVARHAKQKNLEVLLSAFAKARRQRPLRFIVVGHGHVSETSRLRRLAAELELADDVDFVAATPNPFPYMAAAGVLALPSLWEGSSNVLLEAMACGTPVVASRTAGDAEHVLRGGQDGMLVSPHDVDGLASALLRQTCKDRIGPGTRALDFDRHETLGKYIRLFDACTRHALLTPAAA